MLETITRLTGETKSVNLKEMMGNLAQKLTPKHLDKIVVTSSIANYNTEVKWINIVERKEGITGFFSNQIPIFSVVNGLDDLERGKMNISYGKGQKENPTIKKYLDQYIQENNITDVTVIK